MMHAKHLCQMPQVKKSDASSLRQLINHVSSHMIALQAMSLNVPVQDLMLNNLMLTTLDTETARVGFKRCFACRHANHCRAGHIPEIKVQGFGVTPEYPITEDI
jgi:hypothetical protein